MDNVGGVLQEGKSRAIKAIVIFLGMVIYCGGVLYSAVHNWNLLVGGVPDSMVLWAAIGVVALELTALTLPLALHYWTFDAMHRIAAFAFYFADLALIIANVVIDYSMNTGAAADMPFWLSMYKFYGVPGVPVFCIVGWSVLFLLDPSSRQKAMVENLRASTQTALAARIAEAAKHADVSGAVDAAARDLTRQIVGATLGGAVSYGGRLPANSGGYLEAGQAEPEREQPSRPAGRAVLRWPVLRTRRPGRTRYNAESAGHTGELEESGGGADPLAGENHRRTQ